MHPTAFDESIAGGGGNTVAVTDSNPPTDNRTTARAPRPQKIWEYMYSYSASAHSRQLIHFSFVPCTTIHQSKALGLRIPTVYGTSAAELIQRRSSS